MDELRFSLLVILSNVFVVQFLKLIMLWRPSFQLLHLFHGSDDRILHCYGWYSTHHKYQDVTLSAS